MSREHGFIPINEYVADSARRMEENELVVDELHTVTFALHKTWLHRKEAVRLLSRVDTVSRLELSPTFYEVELTVFDTGLRPAARERAIFRDGFFERDYAMPMQVNKQEVVGGYFQRYETDLDQEARALHLGSDIVVKARHR